MYINSEHPSRSPDRLCHGPNLYPGFGQGPQPPDSFNGIPLKGEGQVIASTSPPIPSTKLFQFLTVELYKVVTIYYEVGNNQMAGANLPSGKNLTRPHSTDDQPRSIARSKC